MAHFRGTLDGNRGGASRLGSKASGLTVTAHGWNVGARLEVQHGNNGHDYVRVYVNKGSRAPHDAVCLGVFQNIDGQLVQVGTFGAAQREELAALILKAA